MLIHPSSGACDLFVELFHGLYYSGVVSVCRLGLSLFSYQNDVRSNKRKVQICFVIEYTGRWRDACVFLPKISSGMRIPDGDLPICNVCHLLLASIKGESIRRF